MATTLVRKILLQVNADDGDTEAKLNRIGLKADELAKKHPEIAVRVETAAASAKVEVLRRELRQLGKPVDIDVRAKGGGGGGLSGMGTLIATGIVLAMAGLPALAAAAGAATGIALGAALLIGTKKVQGPLYLQFHTMLNGLVGVLRTSVLPLVTPLAQAFQQVGQWAQRLKPQLTAVFGSLGPMVMPLTRGLESLVSGVLPGFLRLMQAGRPAMQAFAGFLGQVSTGVGKMLGTMVSGVGPASKFLSGFGSAIGALLPPLGELSNILATALAPLMQSLGTSVIPQLAASLTGVLKPMAPLLGSLGKLLGSMLELTGGLLGSATSQVNGLTGAFNGLAGAVGKVADGVSWVASHLGMISGILSQVTGIQGTLVPGVNGPMGGGIGAGLGGIFGGISSAFSGLGNIDWAAAGTAGLGSAAWSGGGFGGGTGTRTPGPTNAQTTAANKLGQQIAAALGAGIVATIPADRAKARQLMHDINKELADGAITRAQATSLINSVEKALQSRVATVKADARKLGESLTVTLADQIASSSSASAMATAVGKLLADVKTAYDDGILTLSQDRKLTTWLDAEAKGLEGIAARRAYIVKEIVAAKQLAATTAGNVAGNYGLSNFATSGVNGGPVGMGAIIGGLRGDVKQIREFGINIKKLAKAGLNKAYLGQLIALGPVQGGELAEELATSGLGDIRTINALEGQITSASGSIGKMAANIQFEGGKAASQGFLTELEKQKAQLDKAGQQIARALVKELRKDLGPGGAAAGNKVTITLKGDKALREWLKKSIRITGGQVEVVGA